MSKLKTTVRNIVANVIECEPDDVTEISGLTRTYNWDSLNHVLIMTQIEEHFGVEINESNIEHLCTFELICKFLKQNINE